MTGMSDRGPGRRRGLAGIALAGSVLAGLLPAGAALATAPGDVVISEIYGGGGGTGAPYNQDFVELHNRTGSAIALTGYSVQYTSAAGIAWTVVALNGSIAAHAYYLVGLATGVTGASLPAADVTSTGLNISNARGKVALLSTTTPCGTTCLSRSDMMDHVGYGDSANVYEGTGPAPTLDNTLSAQRKNGGDKDTNDNAADFASASPFPQNSGSPAYSSDTEPPTGVRIGALAPFQSSVGATVRWTATDSGVGVAGYTVKARIATTDADFGAGEIWQSDVSATSAAWSGAGGQTVCFQVKARDVADNQSGFSAEKCTAFPLDDTVFTRTRFTTLTSAGTLGGSVSRAKAKGAKLVSPTVTGKRFALIVTRCPSCGAIKVLWNNVPIKSLSLAAKTTRKRAIVALPARPNAQSGRLTIVVTTAGKPVLIDGLGVSRN